MCCLWLESSPGWTHPGQAIGMGMLPAGAPPHPPGSCGTRAGGSGIHPAELGDGSSGPGGRAGLPAGRRSARGSQGWGCSPGGAGGCPGCSCRRRGASWLWRTRTSSLRWLETGIARVCGRLGAGLPQLLPPVHTVCRAGWLPALPAEGTGTSEEPQWRPRFGIAGPRAGERQRNGAAAGC